MQEKKWTPYEVHSTPSRTFRIDLAPHDLVWIFFSRVMNDSPGCHSTKNRPKRTSCYLHTIHLIWAIFQHFSLFLTFDENCMYEDNLLPNTAWDYLPLPVPYPKVRVPFLDLLVPILRAYSIFLLAPPNPGFWTAKMLQPWHLLCLNLTDNNWLCKCHGHGHLRCSSG